MASLWLKSTQSTTITVLPVVPQTSVMLKAFSHLTFSPSCACQDYVKFLSFSCKRKSLIRTLLLIATDFILENANPDVTCGHNFSCEMYCEVTGQFKYSDIVIRRE